MVQKLMTKKMHEMLIEEIQLLGRKSGAEKEGEDSSSDKINGEKRGKASESHCA